MNIGLISLGIGFMIGAVSIGREGWKAFTLGLLFVLGGLI